jgi:hypothetical protein
VSAKLTRPEDTTHLIVETNHSLLDNICNNHETTVGSWGFWLSLTDHTCVFTTRKLERLRGGNFDV